MRKLKDLLGGTFAAIYFVFPMSFVLLVLIFMPLGFLTDVSSIRNSGFAGPSTASSLIGVCGFAIGLSLLIPSLRKMYSVLPWLYPFTKIFFADLVILNIALSILNFGYQVNNASRHTIFYILMILALAIGRLAMCLYFKSRPIKYIQGR